ncbi:Altered inheritance of mitochondria protein 32, partial [Linum perenne]
SILQQNAVTTTTHNSDLPFLKSFLHRLLMGSHHREDPLSYPTSIINNTATNNNNPSSSSSPITVSDYLDPASAFLSSDPSSNSLLGSASNSFQNDPGFLTDTSTNIDAEFGFSRPDFRQSPLVGTVHFYHRHVFLCYKNPSVWPTRIEASEFDRLPRLLSAAVTARKADMLKETCLTICEGHDGTETSNGDVLIFPDMVRYRSITALFSSPIFCLILQFLVNTDLCYISQGCRRLTHFDVDTFVEEVLVKDGEWLPGTPEKLHGSYVFVCSHSSRDRHCGVCGPVIITRFKEEVEVRGLQAKVSVSACSHIGGHKYAGNIIIFGATVGGGISGHWYGYVSPDDVPILLEQHICRGEIVDSLWRGQMGLTEEDQIKCQEQRLQLNGNGNVESSNDVLRKLKETSTALSVSKVEATGYSQENGNSSYSQSPVLTETKGSEAKMSVSEKKKSTMKLLSRLNSGKRSPVHRFCGKPTWLDSWELEDTYAAAAVVCAAVSVAVAYNCYRQLS